MLLFFLGKRRCDDPGNLQGGFRTGNDLWEGNKVTFHCLGDFYYIKGGRELTCLSNGTWSSSIPFCEFFGKHNTMYHYSIQFNSVQ